MGSGCGTVDSVDAIDTRGPGFESCHRQLLLNNYLPTMVAAIAPWFRLRLPYCGPGFESQALHLCFFQFLIDL